MSVTQDLARPTGRLYAVPPVARSGAAPAFAVLDVETTGLSPRTDRIIELGVVRLDEHGTFVDEWTCRFDPEGPVGATFVHGITADDVAGAPLFRDVAPQVVAYLTGMVVVAHNVRFDMSFLTAELTRAGWSVPDVPALCTLDVSRSTLPDLDRRKLADCCGAARVRLRNAHSALGDAQAAAGLLWQFQRGFRGAEVRAVLSDAARQAVAVEWPSSPSRAPEPAPVRNEVRQFRRPSRPTLVPAPADRPAPTSDTRTSATAEAQPLARQVAAMTITDILDEGAPAGATPYMQRLLDVLEDGELTPEESATLAEVTALYRLSPGDVAKTHQAYLRALAHRALDDGIVTRDERTELHRHAELLGQHTQVVTDVLAQAKAARTALLSKADAIRPLPHDWQHGEPLRVGDKVAFTGCTDAGRPALEQRATDLGVRVVGNVSRYTAMLVTDGTFSGGKASRAAEIGTRTVHPRDFALLLDHVQPAVRSSGI